MYCEQVTFTDYNGVERTEKFYFNLTEAEIAEMELGTTGGLAEMIEKLIASQDIPSIVEIFKNLLLKAYGEKSPDGRRFIKSEELRTAFSQTGAYSDLFMKYAFDAEASSKFVNGIMPKNMADKIPELTQQKENQEES